MEFRYFLKLLGSVTCQQELWLSCCSVFTQNEGVSPILCDPNVPSSPLDPPSGSFAHLATKFLSQVKEQLVYGILLTPTDVQKFAKSHYFQLKRSGAVVQLFNST